MMRAGEPLAITGVGGASPLGASAIETAASLRAGICRFSEQDDTCVPMGAAPAVPGDPLDGLADRLIASTVADLPLSVAGPARVFELALRALRDLFFDGELDRATLGRAGLFLALPDDDAVTATWGLARSLGPALLDRLGLPSIPVIAVRTAGAAGSLAILGDAAGAVRGGSIASAVVLGADTFIDRERLRLLDRDFRIKSARASAGMIPGEAAGALLLESAGGAGRRGARVLATLAGVGEGAEPQPNGGERESSGRGLCQALRAALPPTASSVTDEAARWIICDLNGEPYRAVEWGVALARLSRELGTLARLSHPADCLGEVGAGSGGIFVAQAIAGFARSSAPAPEALLWAGSGGGLRAAARLLAPVAGAMR
jgi:3-oxoacyl-[acyl-carrier-protein] synthase-1